MLEDEDVRQQEEKHAGDGGEGSSEEELEISGSVKLPGVSVETSEARAVEEASPSRVKEAGSEIRDEGDSNAQREQEATTVSSPEGPGPKSEEEGVEKNRDAEEAGDIEGGAKTDSLNREVGGHAEETEAEAKTVDNSGPSDERDGEHVSYLGDDPFVGQSGGYNVSVMLQPVITDAHRSPKQAGPESVPQDSSMRPGSTELALSSDGQSDAEKQEGGGNPPEYDDTDEDEEENVFQDPIPPLVACAEPEGSAVLDDDVRVVPNAPELEGVEAVASVSARSDEDLPTEVDATQTSVDAVPEIVELGFEDEGDGTIIESAPSAGQTTAPQAEEWAEVEGVSHPETLDKSEEGVFTGDSQTASPEITTGEISLGGVLEPDVSTEEVGEGDEVGLKAGAEEEEDRAIDTEIVSVCEEGGEAAGAVGDSEHEPAGVAAAGQDAGVETRDEGDDPSGGEEGCEEEGEDKVLPVSDKEEGIPQEDGAQREYQVGEGDVTQAPVENGEEEHEMETAEQKLPIVDEGDLEGVQHGDEEDVVFLQVWKHSLHPSSDSLNVFMM